MGILDKMMGRKPDFVEETIEPGIGGQPAGSPLSPMIGKLPDNPYPTAIAPLDRAYLRPLQTPIWDVEVYDPKRPEGRIDFFCRPIGVPMQYCEDIIKTRNDTCLKYPNGLIYPFEYSILGFKFLIERGVSEADQDELINGGTFHFQFLGREEYADIPLETFPTVMRRPSEDNLAYYYDQMLRIWSDTKIDRLIASGAAEITKEIIQADTYYKFNLGRAALKIKPAYKENGEPIEDGKAIDKFTAWVAWNRPPRTSRPVRLMVVIPGLFWKPL